MEYLVLLRRILAAICCLFGLPGNLLTIIVCIKALCQRTINFERKVFDLFLAEISILDTWLLLYWIIEIALQYFHSNEYFSLLHTSAFSCRFFYMTNRLFAALCSWLITCFTLIRFLNIFRRFNTIRSNIILVTCLTVIFSLANSYLIISIGYNEKPKAQSYDNSSRNHTEEHPNSTPCMIRNKHVNNSVLLLLNTLVAGFLNLAIPSMITFIVNVAIVCYIKRIYKTQNPEPIQRRSEYTGPNYRSSRSTLLVISITYTICYLPYCIIYLLRIQFPQLSVTLLNWAEIAYIMRYISHSVNFYAYIFTNHRFRRDIILLLRNLLRPCAYIKKRRQIKKKSKARNEFRYQHYRLPQSTNSVKMICAFHRPTSSPASNNPKNHYLQPNDGIYNKQNTILATISPTQSSEKLRNRTRV